MDQKPGGCTFEELGSSIWNNVRSQDAVGMWILRYYSQKDIDRAECVMRMAMPFEDDMVRGAYHCLCGLGFLEPYIDREGVECARITKKGMNELAEQ